MTRVSPLQRSFAGGEVSPLLDGRDDFPRHANGLKKCRGFIPLVEGAATRMPGSKFIGYTRNDDVARLIPFVFRDEDTYMLEFTDGTQRVWRDQEVVQDGGGGDYQLATPYDLAVLDVIQHYGSADRIYMVDGEQHPQRLSRFADNDWLFEDTPFEGGPFLPQNVDKAQTIYATVETGSGALVSDFDIFEAGHVGAFFRLQMVDDDVATFQADESPAVNALRKWGGNYYRVDTAPGANAGSTPPSHTEGIAATKAGGPTYEYLHSGWGVCQITAYTDARNVSMLVTKRLPSQVVGASKATYRWNEGAWSDVRGWPGLIAEHQQRVFYGATPTEPRTLYFPATGSRTEFSPGTDPDEAFTYELAAEKGGFAQLRWGMSTQDGLYIGSGTDARVIVSTDQNGVFGPTSIRNQQVTEEGCANFPAELVDGRPIFLSKSGERFLATRYDFNENKQGVENLLKAARHIGLPGVAEIVWQSDPVTVLWGRTLDGDLVGVSHDRAEEFVAAHRHKVGGFVERIAVKPTNDGLSQELWMVVRRTLDGLTRRCVEVVQPPFLLPEERGLAAADAWHLWCAVRYQGAATDTITGLDHLEGEDVVAWTDQGAETGLTVASGSVTLSIDVTSAIVGIDMSADDMLHTLDERGGAVDGGSIGRQKNTRAVGLLFAATSGGRVQTVRLDSNHAEIAGKLTPIFKRGAPGDPPVLKSGAADVTPNGGWSKTTELRIRPDPGAPMTLLGLAPIQMTADG